MEKDLNKAGKVILGAICGDIIGSSYEWSPVKNTDFSLFTHHSDITDDSVCTIAVAYALLSSQPFDLCLRSWCRHYPWAGYGRSFRIWLAKDANSQPYNSWGNGSAMRVSPVGAFANSIEEVLDLAAQSAAVTHNHPEGIKGAQSVALAIFLALTGHSKQQIKNEIESRFNYNLSRSLADIRPSYRFDVSCQGSVPEAIIAFLESTDYESTVRLAVSLGGDADTQAAIAGSIAAAFYGEIPADILKKAYKHISSDMITIINQFNQMLNNGLQS